MAVLLTKYHTIVDFRTENECHQTTPLSCNSYLLYTSIKFIFEILISVVHFLPVSLSMHFYKNLHTFYVLIYFIDFIIESSPSESEDGMNFHTCNIKSLLLLWLVQISQISVHKRPYLYLCTEFQGVIYSISGHFYFLKL